MERVLPFDRKHRDDGSSAPLQDAPMINRTLGTREWGILLLLALIWGGSFFFIKVAVTHVAPLTFVWLRVAIAGCALLLFLRIRAESKMVPKTILVPLLILALLNNVVPFLLFAWANTQIASGLASILNATTPIWGVLLAHVYTSDEPLSRGRLAGVMIGFAGVLFMLGNGILTQFGTGLLAQAACLVGAFSYAVAGVYARRFKAAGVGAMSVTAGQLAMSAIVLLPFVLLVDQPWTQPIPPVRAIASILALALVCTGFAYVLYFRLIETSGASNALLVPTLVPPIAILLGWLFLGEALHRGDFIGLGLIALGMAAIDGRLLRLLPRSA